MMLLLYCMCFWGLGCFLYMGFFSFLKVVVFSLLSFSNHVNAQATMNFMPSGEIYLRFNGNNYLFENI